MSRPDRIWSNISAEAGARLLYLATRFFIPPFVLGRVGLEAYGFYGSVFVLVAYFGMSAIGFSSAYVKFVAEFAATGRTREANRLLSAGFTLMTAVGVAGFAGFVAAWPWVAVWLKVPPALQSDARMLAFLIVGVFFAYLAFSVYRDALTSQQEIALVQKVWMGSFLIETLLIFVLVGAGFGLPGLGIAFAVRTLVDLVAHAVLAQSRIPWLRVRFARPDADSLRLLLHFGGIVQLNSMLAIFLNSVERVVATPLLGLSASALLDLGKRFPGMATSIPSAFASSVFPAAADLHARAATPAESRSAIAELYLITMRRMNAISGILFGFLSFAAAPCLVFWLGHVPEGAVELTILFAVSSQIHLLTGPGTSILKATGQPRMEFHYSVANLVALGLLLPAAFVLHGAWTVIGIAQACVGATVLSAGWFLFHAHRNLGVATRGFLSQVLAPGAVPYLVGAAVLQPFAAWAASAGRAHALLGIVVLGAAYVTAALLGLLLLCATPAERGYLRHRLAALRLDSRIEPDVVEPHGELLG